MGSRDGAGSGADSVDGAGSGVDSVGSRDGAGSGSDSVGSRDGAGSAVNSTLKAEPLKFRVKLMYSSVDVLLNFPVSLVDIEEPPCWTHPCWLILC